MLKNTLVRLVWPSVVLLSGQSSQCWPWVGSVRQKSWVCMVWPTVGFGSVRSGPGLVFDLFGLAPVRPWVCSVWPRSRVYSV